ncbi:MAG: tetratricopeptide repeat protein [Bacteroidota bacterium]|nr:tetratricopeptide repeat protein [Bacteroidota bacterium]
MEFLGICGSVYYKLEEYAKAGTYFLQTAERAKASLGEQEYHYSLALFNLAACYKEEDRYAEAEPLFFKSLPVLATAFGQNSMEYSR